MWYFLILPFSMWLWYVHNFCHCVRYCFRICFFANWVMQFLAKILFRILKISLAYVSCCRCSNNIFLSSWLCGRCVSLATARAASMHGIAFMLLLLLSVCNARTSEVFYVWFMFVSGSNLWLPSIYSMEFLSVCPCGHLSGSFVFFCAFFKWLCGFWASYIQRKMRARFKFSGCWV